MRYAPAVTAGSARDDADASDRNTDLDLFRNALDFAFFRTIDFLLDEDALHANVGIAAVFAVAAFSSMSAMEKGSNALLANGDFFHTVDGLLLFLLFDFRLALVVGLLFVNNFFDHSAIIAMTVFSVTTTGGRRKREQKCRQTRDADGDVLSSHGEDSSYR